MKTIKFKENHEVRKGIIFLVFVLLCNLGVSADTFISGNLKYTTTSSSTVSVSKNEIITGKLVIPETVKYNGTQYAVTSIGKSAFYGCTGLTSVTIPNSVTSIGDWAFYACRGLTSADIPNSVTSVGDYAFSECTGLTSVDIPNSVTSIGVCTFLYCPSLTEINVNDNNATYSSIDGVLFNKSQTELIQYPGGKQGTYTIPNSVTSIGRSAFESCTGLTSVDIPNSVTNIERYAFEYCNGLTSVTIPNSVTSIGDWAFSGCSGLTEINVDENNTAYSSIDGVLFNKSQTELILYPRGKQGTYTIPNSVTSIEESAFRGCTGLTSVTIGNSVTSINPSMFSDCTGLTEINVDEHNTTYSSIDGVLYNKLQTELILCPKGKQGACTVPNTVTSIRLGVFEGCKGLTAINVDENNTAYSSIDGVLFNKSQTELVRYPEGKQGAYSIPNSVTSIGNSAFSGCTDLTSVTIPNSVESIGNWAFKGCTGLTSVTIPNSVTSIGSQAFWFCEGLTSVTIPNSVTSIGIQAFTRCTGLTSVTIGNSVTSIGSGAFYGCTGLTDIYCHIEEPLTITTNVFSNVPTSTSTLHVPIGSKEKYKIADVWKYFWNIVEDLPTGIVSIDNSQLTIDNDVWYTLNGVRLNGKPTKAGVYIVNGKTVVIK